MDILNSLWAGFAVAALPINLALIVGGCFAGTLIGAPGRYCQLFASSR